jgi:hypothetical protein
MENLKQKWANYRGIFTVKDVQEFEEDLREFMHHNVPAGIWVHFVTDYQPGAIKAVVHVDLEAPRPWWGRLFQHVGLWLLNKAGSRARR